MVREAWADAVDASIAWVGRELRLIPDANWSLRLVTGLLWRGYLMHLGPHDVTRWLGPLHEVLADHERALDAEGLESLAEHLGAQRTTYDRPATRIRDAAWALLDETLANSTIGGQ